ncbi:type VI secretion system baseplate subunit TssG [bacterium]|nr:type VI secretion system baseplate subunit TssG [bacterium]
MVADAWRAESSLIKEVADDGRNFDFYQAVRLIELARREADSISTTASPGREAVQFLAAADFGFPSTDISKIELLTDTRNEPWRGHMTVNFMGLAGAHGPLPAPFTRVLLDRLKSGDTILRDFLDIFNHRLISLLYSVRKHHRVAFDWQPQGEDRFSRFLFSLIGMRTKEGSLRHRMRVPDRALLPYAGLIAQEPRAAIGLQLLISDYFKMDVEVREFAGRWLSLPADERTSIGVTGTNRALGTNFVLGKRIYDVQSKFELCLGSSEKPLNLRRFQDHLPSGKGYHSVVDLTSFFTRKRFDFDIRLTLRAEDVPPFQLVSASPDQPDRGPEFFLDLHRGSLLGWTTWLKTQPFEKPDSQVRLREHE